VTANRATCAFDCVVEIVTHPPDLRCKATAPSANERPFDPDKRFDSMAFYKRIWRKSIDLADVEPLRIHDLRHTAAALMLSSGMPITMVSRQLGHDSTATTDHIYGGLLSEAVVDAVDDFDEWLAAQG